jgi:hypothetical protein
MVFQSVGGLMPGDVEHPLALVKGGGQAAHLDHERVPSWRDSIRSIRSRSSKSWWV